MQSKVYFSDFHTPVGRSILDKYKALLIKAGIGQLDLDGKLTAIKIHFGEYGNLAFLRPNYARILVDLIKEGGGIPFLTDCNTLYVGSRKNAVEHLETAALNGFTPSTTGCQLIIADGLRGLDEMLIPVNGETVSEAKIGSAIAGADVVISLTHFKGHESTGFGGALKNLGMGSGSRAGKMEMHYSGKPQVYDIDNCVGCGACRRICAHGAPIITSGKCHIDQDICVGCGRCIAACPRDVIEPVNGNSEELLHKRIDEYTKAVLKGKQNFHISVVCDVSPCCDCHSENDIPLIPNVGMFASFDPVALDRACADACNKMPRHIGSLNADVADCDVFHAAHSNTDWQVGLDYAEKIGLGTQEYELITVK